MLAAAHARTAGGQDEGPGAAGPLDVRALSRIAYLNSDFTPPQDRSSLATVSVWKLMLS